MALPLKVKVPRALIINDPSPQAYALGLSWKKAHIILTTGLLERLSPEDIQATLAYCVASIQRQNIFSQLVATAFISFLTGMTQSIDNIYRWLIGLKGDGPYFYYYPFTYIFSPLVQVILKLLVPESEYIKTDSQAASLIGNPKDLALALWKLESYRVTLPLEVSPSLAHGFIVNPLTNKGWFRYFCSHPSLQLRIENLVGHYPI